MSLEDQAAEPINEDELREPAPGPKFPLPTYTIVILVCIAAVCAVQLYFDPPGDAGLFDILLSPFNATALAAGFDKQAFVQKGEFWRLFTGFATHGFILHALMNSYVLYSFGKLFEFLSYRGHLPVVFLLAAIGGSLLSLMFMPYGLSVGASGGILGIVSYLAVYAFRRRQFISPAFRKNMVFNIGFILVFGLVLFRYVDNYGHIGGLAVGAIYGLIQIPSDPRLDPREGGQTAKKAGLVSLFLFGMISAFAIYKIIVELG